MLVQLPEIKKLESNVYYIEQSKSSNVACIELSESLVFVDAGVNSEVVKVFRSEMETRLGKKTSHLFLTHFDLDHIAGMEAFEDCVVVGSKVGFERYAGELETNLSAEGRRKTVTEAREYYTKMGREIPENFGETLLNARLVMPENRVEVKSEYTLLNTISFVVTGGHTVGSAYILMHHFVFVGDNLTSAVTTQGGCFFARINRRQVAIIKHYETLEAIHVLPGHGPATDMANVKTTWQYFDKLIDILADLKEEGVPAEDLEQHPRIPEFYEPDLPNQWGVVLQSMYSRLLEPTTDLKFPKLSAELEVEEKEVWDVIKTYFISNVTSDAETFDSIWDATASRHSIGNDDELHAFNRDQIVQLSLEGLQKAKETIPGFTVQIEVESIDISVRSGTRTASVEVQYLMHMPGSIGHHHCIFLLARAPDWRIVSCLDRGIEESTK